MTVKIYGGPQPGPITEAKKAEAPRAAKQADKAQMKDHVDFSTVLQDVSKAKATAAAADPERTEKVQALKEQIADGSYQPDLQKVAASLLRFLVEER